jgi:hypothetical protein
MQPQWPTGANDTPAEWLGIGVGLQYQEIPRTQWLELRGMVIIMGSRSEHTLCPNRLIEHFEYPAMNGKSTKPVGAGFEVTEIVTF